MRWKFLIYDILNNLMSFNVNIGQNSIDWIWCPIYNRRYAWNEGSQTVKEKRKIEIIEMVNNIIMNCIILRILMFALIDLTASFLEAFLKRSTGDSATWCMIWIGKLHEQQKYRWRWNNAGISSDVLYSSTFVECFSTKST